MTEKEESCRERVEDVICSCVIGICCFFLISLVTGIMLSIALTVADYDLNRDGTFEDYVPQRCVVQGAQLLQSWETNPVNKCGTVRNKKSCRRHIESATELGPCRAGTRPTKS